MGNCDLCGTNIGPEAKRYPASQFKVLVQAGLRPPASERNRAIMLSGGRASIAEWEAGWVQMVMKDSSDWALCDPCRGKADTYRASTKEKGCFIATAIYGNVSAPEIQCLSACRDEILKKSILGRMLVRIYYYVSPSLADFIAQSHLRKALVQLLLRPIVFFCSRHSMRSDGPTSRY